MIIYSFFNGLPERNKGSMNHAKPLILSDEQPKSRQSVVNHHHYSPVEVSHHLADSALTLINAFL